MGAASKTSAISARNGVSAKGAQDDANTAKQDVATKQVAYTKAKKATDEAYKAWQGKLELENAAKELDDKNQALKKAATEKDDAAKSVLAGKQSAFDSANSALTAATATVTAQEAQLEADKGDVKTKTEALETAKKALAENKDPNEMSKLEAAVTTAQKKPCRCEFKGKNH